VFNVIIVLVVTFYFFVMLNDIVLGVIIPSVVMVFVNARHFYPSLVFSGMAGASQGGALQGL
jgi:hypothetical protein